MKTLSIFLALVLAIGAIMVPMQSFAQEENEDNGDFQVEVSAEQNTLSRGSDQTLNIEASEEADIIGSITYASDFIRAFSGSTDEEGTFTYEWRIGGNSNPGTFNVLVIALGAEDAAVATTSFEVTTAPIEAPEEGEPMPPAVDNGTISEGNGTVIVPEEPVPLPVENGTDTAGNETTEPEPEPVPEIPTQTVNETIPVPVPINNTTGNETIPVPIPINTTTGNETIPIPELPIEDNGTGVTITPTPVENQTETLPEEIPAANETTTVPIPIPINQSTGNETIPVPEIPIEVNETAPVEPTIPGTNATVPGGNATEPEPEPESTPTPEPEPTPTTTNQTGNATGPITPETPSEDIISVLEERTATLENQTAEQQEVFVAVGAAVQDIANTISVLPGLTEEEQAAVVESVQNLHDAIADLD